MSMTEVAEKPENTKETDLLEKVSNTFDEEGVYLSGPIRCVDDNGIPWREEIIEDYSELKYNNPLARVNPEEVEVLNDPVHFDSHSDKEQVLPSDYVSEDKIMIDRSKCLFVGLPNEIARGTMMECMYAYMLGIPFFVWKMDGQEESGWVYSHSTFMSDDRDEVMEEVKRYVQQGFSL